MIAISYRREDSSPAAGRLYDRLQAEFGKGNVFMDFDSIPYGVDFREKIKQTLDGAQLVVAVIGPNWMGSRGRGKRRINDPTDFVRMEIAQALLLKIPVIPVLLDDTAMPKVEVLPEDLRGLAYRNALTLDTGVDFHHHASRLIAGIRKFVTVPPSVPEAIAHSAAIPEEETIAARPPSIPEKSAIPERNRIKWIIAGAVVLLGVVTLVAVWSVVTAIGRAINDKRGDQSSLRPELSVRPQATETPSSVVTTFKAETPSPAPTTSHSPSPSPEPTATVAATATAVATLPPSSPFVVASTPFPTPAWTPAPELISEQECEVLVKAFYRTVERKDMNTLLSFFDEKVDYHTDGEQGKAAVKDDFTRYFKRWPVASFSIGDVRIKHAPSPDTVIIVFDIGYSVRDPASKRNTTGRADEVWVLQRINGTPKIISQRENVHPDSVPQHPKRR